MGKIREWIPIKTNIPKQMEDVLICSNNGEIYKAFLNLNNVWIIQNTNSLISWRYRDEESIIAWMKLPSIYKKYSREGWIPISKTLPNRHTPVLISTKDAIYISHVRSEGNDMWWIRNKNEKGSDSVYLSKNSVMAWMPLPEIFKTTITTI